MDLFPWDDRIITRISMFPGNQSTVRFFAFLGGFGLLFFMLPLFAMLTQLNVADWVEQLSESQVRKAWVLSFVTATGSTLFALVIGFPIAWTLARCSFTGREFVRVIVTTPMILPPVVAGLALLQAFGQQGIVGRWLYALGMQLPFSTVGVVVAATFVAAPFLIVTLETALSEVDPRLEEAAATLGASPFRVLWTITLPTIRPALTAGLALSWARALGEFGATITFAGNLSGVTQTMPLAVYEAMHENLDRAVFMSLVLLVTSFSILLVLRNRRSSKWI